MPNIGPMELVVILALALLILGPKRLPDAGRSLGRGMREFKDSLTGREPEAAHAHELDAAAPAPSEHA
jgi:sec-independent protein translocase protein TatA